MDAATRHAAGHGSLDVLGVQSNAGSPPNVSAEPGSSDRYHRQHGEPDSWRGERTLLIEPAFPCVSNGGSGRGVWRGRGRRYPSPCAVIVQSGGETDEHSDHWQDEQPQRMRHEPGHRENNPEAFSGEKHEKDRKPGRGITVRTNFAELQTEKLHCIPDRCQNCQSCRAYQQLLLERAKCSHASCDDHFALEYGGGKDGNICAGRLIRQRWLTENDEPAHGEARPTTLKHAGIIGSARRV